MGFKLKSTTTGSTSPNNNTNGDNWGMGFLLVLFPEDSNATNAIVDKTNKLFSPTSSFTSCSTPSPSSSSFKRSNSNNVLLSKAQSTISICALLVFITLLLFTLSTFEPNSKTHPISTVSRRFLSQNSAADPKFTNTNLRLRLSSSPWFGKSKMWKQQKQRTPNLYALQRMGTLYRRGTRAMPDLVVGHVDNDVTDAELRLFLRLLHRSGLTSRADIVFIFASSSASSKSASVIRQENESFLKLLHHYRQSNRTAATRPGFDGTQFVKSGKKATEEPLWGKKSSSNSSSNSSSESEEVEEAESTQQQLSYGSVLGFEVGELDPENSLAGFVVDHHVAMSLRRWACYPMLLGRVRRNFKHVMLVDVKNILVVGDPLNRARHKSAESVMLLSAKHCTNGNKKGSVDPTAQCPVNTTVISGGARGVRRLSSTVLMEIVRAAVSQPPKKRKSSAVMESAILSGLVGNVFVTKNIDLVTSTETVPDASSIITTAAAAAGSVLSHAVIQRGNSHNHHELYSIIMKQICSSELDSSSVYSDC